MSLRDGLDMLKLIRELKPKLRPWRDATATVGVVLSVAVIAKVFGYDILRTGLTAAVAFCGLVVLRCFSDEGA